MSTSKIVLPLWVGADRTILQGVLGTTSVPIFGCLVVHWSCFGTTIWSGLLFDEAMRPTAFTRLSNCCIGPLEFTLLEPVHQFPQGMHRCCRPTIRHLLFPAMQDLLPWRFHYTGHLECCRVVSESIHSLDLWGHCPDGSAVQSRGGASPPSHHRGFAVYRAPAGIVRSWTNT